MLYMLYMLHMLYMLYYCICCMCCICCISRSTPRTHFCWMSRMKPAFCYACFKWAWNATSPACPDCFLLCRTLIFAECLERKKFSLAELSFSLNVSSGIEVLTCRTIVFTACRERNHDFDLQNLHFQWMSRTKSRSWGWLGLLGWLGWLGSLPGLDFSPQAPNVYFYLISY